MNYDTPAIINLTHILETLLKRIEMRPECVKRWVMLAKMEKVKLV